MLILLLYNLNSNLNLYRFLFFRNYLSLNIIKK